MAPPARWQRRIVVHAGGGKSSAELNHPVVRPSVDWFWPSATARTPRESLVAYPSPEESTKAHHQGRSLAERARAPGGSFRNSSAAFAPTRHAEAKRRRAAATRKGTLVDGGAPGKTTPRWTFGTPRRNERGKHTSQDVSDGVAASGPPGVRQQAKAAVGCRPQQQLEEEGRPRGHSGMLGGASGTPSGSTVQDRERRREGLAQKSLRRRPSKARIPRESVLLSGSQTWCQ